MAATSIEPSKHADQRSSGDDNKENSGGANSGTISKNDGRFGFIKPDSGAGPEMFVIPAACAGFGGRIPPLQTPVQYAVVNDEKTGRPRADNVEPVGGGSMHVPYENHGRGPNYGPGRGGGKGKGGWHSMDHMAGGRPGDTPLQESQRRWSDWLGDATASKKFQGEASEDAAAPAMESGADKSHERGPKLCALRPAPLCTASKEFQGEASEDAAAPAMESGADKSHERGPKLCALRTCRSNANLLCDYGMCRHHCLTMAKECSVHDASKAPRRHQGVMSRFDRIQSRRASRWSDFQSTFQSKDSRPMCWYFAVGRCLKADKCNYSHDVEKVSGGQQPSHSESVEVNGGIPVQTWDRRFQ